MKIKKMFCSKTVKIIVIVAFVLVLIAGGAIFYAVKQTGWLTEQDFLRSIPAEFGVSKVLYHTQNHEYIGLPGDNGAWMAVYELPENQAEQIANSGISAVSGKIEWRSTHPESDNPTERFWDKDENGLYLSFLRGESSDWMDVTPEIQDLVIRAISSPGNYYFIDKYVCYIVAPQEKRVIYMFIK